MRELKFRAWNILGKEMWDEIVILDKDFVMRGDSGCPLNAGIKQLYLGEDFEIMQFTGLLDRKGTEIYEGDIVDRGYPNKTVAICEIKYGIHHYEDGYESIGFYLEDQDGGTGDYGDRWNELEIIGNIYENESLLKKGGEKYGK